MTDSPVLVLFEGSLPAEKMGVVIMQTDTETIIGDICIWQGVSSSARGFFANIQSSK